MNSTIKKILILCLLTSLNALGSSFSKLPTPKINAQDIKKLESGKYIFKTENVNDAIWPVITMTQLIDASPLESIAIFLALDYQYKYLPSLIKSQPIKHISPVEVLARYEMKMPWPLSNSKYLHGSVLSKLKNQVYHAGWYMIESNSAKKVDGNGWFIPHGSKTILVYRSYVIPNTILAGLIKNQMYKEVRSAMLATKEEIESVKAKKPQLMTKYKLFILNALAGKNVYETSIQNNKK